MYVYLGMASSKDLYIMVYLFYDMKSKEIGELRISEDEIPDGWYVVGRSNNKVFITNMDYPRLEIKYEEDDYIFSSKPEHHEFIQESVQEVGFNEGNEEVISSESIREVLNYVEENFD